MNDVVVLNHFMMMMMKTNSSSNIVTPPTFRRWLTIVDIHGDYYKSAFSIVKNETVWIN